MCACKVSRDGTLYRSQDYTFHTPKGDAAGTQPETRPTGTNLALLSGGAKIAGVSSNYGGDNTSSFGANNAFDGNPATQWSSNGDGDKAWIEVELPTSAHITGIGFWSRTMGTSARFSYFQGDSRQRPKLWSLYAIRCRQYPLLQHRLHRPTPALRGCRNERRQHRRGRNRSLRHSLTSFFLICAESWNKTPTCCV